VLNKIENFGINNNGKNKIFLGTLIIKEENKNDYLFEKTDILIDTIRTRILQYKFLKNEIRNV